jgi:hypothetical protein
MKEAAIIFTCLLISFHQLPAQAIDYRSNNYLGIVEGENGSSFQMQTIHGLSYKSWYAGLGAGLDYYRYRSVPVFFSLNRDIIIRSKTFFLSGDAGVNYPWVKNGHVSIWWAPTEQEYKRGLYWATGIGYKAFFKNKKDAILINLGYSYKQLKQETVSTTVCNEPPCQVDIETFNYRMRRISVRLGWQF